MRLAVTLILVALAALCRAMPAAAWPADPGPDNSVQIALNKPWQPCQPFQDKSGPNSAYQQRRPGAIGQSQRESWGRRHNPYFPRHTQKPYRPSPCKNNPYKNSPYRPANK